VHHLRYEVEILPDALLLLLEELVLEPPDELLLFEELERLLEAEQSRQPDRASIRIIETYFGIFLTCFRTLPFSKKQVLC
jgi:hypothetical protein